MPHRVVRLILALALCTLVIAPALSATGAATAWPLEQRGASGPNVVAVQYLLAAHGYSLSVDGAFGPQTQSRVEAFQKAAGLAADGIVGSLTWPRLIITVRRGSNGDAVKATQYLLRYKYAAHLSVNGYFGSTTEAAVQEFQRAAGLSNDGIAGPDTWGALVADATGSIAAVPAPTPVPRRAILDVTPRSTVRGAIVTASGRGFAPGEIVDLYFTALPGAITAIRATAAGVLPATRLPIPATLAVGAHTLIALGVTSRRDASAVVTVVAPAPVPVHATLTVAPLTINRGGVVTASGRGFAANEIVDLYFTALPGVVTAARATAAGVLPATGVGVPYGLAPGAHTIVALGATSKRSASVVVRVVALAPSISVSAETVSPGGAVTVRGQGFGPAEQVTLALNGVALATTPPVIATTAAGAFSAALVVPIRLLSGPNTLSAVGNRSRVTAITTLSGVLPVASRSYIAGGMNSATEQSTLRLLNTNAGTARVRLTFFFGSGATDTKLVSVAPTSEKLIPVASLEPFTGPFGLYVEGDHAVTAQLDLTRDGQDGDALLGNPGLATKWYLAEGYTGLTFHESVAILNTDFNAPAQVQLQLLPTGGRAPKSVAVTVPPHAEYLVDINSQMPAQAVSIIASSDRPVAVERTLTFSNDGYGLSTRMGTTTPATSWIFAEGTTTTRFQTFLTVLNPNVAPAAVTASFYSSSGAALGSKTIVAPGMSRATLKLNDFLHASGIASVVTSNLPVVVERPEYFGNPNDSYTAGSDVFGRNGAGLTWFFPGGETGSHNEYLLVYNPSVEAVTIDAAFYGANGVRVVKRFTVPPTVRYNLNVNETFAGLDPQHGMRLQSANHLGFVAEQTVFAPDYSTLASTQGASS